MAVSAALTRQFPNADNPTRAHGSRGVKDGDTRTPATFTITLGFIPSFVRIVSTDDSTGNVTPVDNFQILHSFFAEQESSVIEPKSLVLETSDAAGACKQTYKDCGIRLFPEKGRGFTVNYNTNIFFTIDRASNTIFWEAWG